MPQPNATQTVPDTLPADFNFEQGQAQPAGTPGTPDTLPADFDFSKPQQVIPQASGVQGAEPKLPEPTLSSSEEMPVSQAETDSSQTGVGKAGTVAQLGIPAAGALAVAAVPTLMSHVGPIADTLAGHILEHGTELATKYPNVVALAGKLGWKAPASTIGALLYAYEHFKK
jgi:hypothetical protein